MIAPCKDIVPLGKGNSFDRNPQIQSLLWGKSSTCMCEPFQPGSCSKRGAHFEVQTSAFGNPTIFQGEKTGSPLSAQEFHLYIICPLVKPAFRFRGFCWFLLLLCRLCHFHLLLTEDYLNKPLHKQERWRQKVTSLNHSQWLLSNPTHNWSTIPPSNI